MTNVVKDNIARGRQYEQVMDTFFEQDYAIQRASREDDLRGIDRFFQSKKAPRLKFPVQYKVDFKGKDTGNLPIEVVSNDRTGTPGWALGCDASHLLFYLPWRAGGQILMLSTSGIRLYLPAWLIQYQTRPTSPELNNGYQTHNICIPVNRFATLDGKLTLPCLGAWRLSKKPDDAQSTMWAFE